MTPNLTDADIRLGDTLIAWLLSEMVWRLSPDAPEPGLLWDGAQSNFELACDALARHGALRGEGENWRVLAAPQIRPVDTRRDLDRLLNALACHAPYVEELFPFGDPVSPQDADLVALCGALAACGYMESEVVKSRLPWSKPRTRWFWTTAFDPWLALHGGLDWDTVALPEASDVAQTLAEIPAAQLAVLSGDMCRAPAQFVRVFCGGWQGDGWRTSADRDAAIPHGGWRVDLAAALYLHLHRDEG